MALAHYSPTLTAVQLAPTLDDASWIDSFSVSKYRPLLRLASQDDHVFVREQLGVDVGKAYKDLRKTVVRDYLRSLSEDFQRIHQIASAKALMASNDDGALSLALVEQKMNFIFSMWTIELRLAVGGYIPSEVSLSPVLAYVETLALQTRELTRPQLSIRVM